MRNNYAIMTNEVSYKMKLQYRWKLQQIKSQLQNSRKLRENK